MTFLNNKNYKAIKFFPFYAHMIYIWSKETLKYIPIYKYLKYMISYVI